MGCCCSSPYSKRRYRDPSDLDEDHVPIRYFGTNRVGSNLVPDDIGGLPSTHLQVHLASNKDVMLYQAEIDHGKAFRCCSFQWLLCLGISNIVKVCSCDEPCCWVRKEYSTRTFFRVYPNRIDINDPTFRCPFGCLGCGSWNGDKIVSHPFDRGAFGFQHIRFGAPSSCFFCMPIFGGAVARQRCQCNGPLWNRMFSDCGGWWCDEWCCQMCFSYQYSGLAYPDEVAFAASIALQAYFEGRVISQTDMQQCINFWRQNLSERWNPVERKRPVCCEPIIVPTPKCICYYTNVTHPTRINPYSGDANTNDLEAAYDQYQRERETQINDFSSFYGPTYLSTLCRSGGCRRCCGRKGCCFCIEGCDNCARRAGEPAPPFDTYDFDDDWDASTVLMSVLGPPPKNVCVQRWRYDPETKENYLEVYPDVEENNRKDAST